MSIYEWVHLDTCLAGYWSGHHLPHVQIPVYKNMKLKDIKKAIIDELRFGYVAGNGHDAQLLNRDFINPEDEKRADYLTRKAYAAANRLRGAVKGKRVFFEDLDCDDSEDGESVYAFFVLVEVE